MKKIFKKLKTNFGEFLIEKQFPASNYGDTIGTHKITKKPVAIKDLSQFFKLRFKNIVCIDSVISFLKEFPLFDAVYGPFTAVLLTNPNDYKPIEQWELVKINAPGAWNITTGSQQVKIGISDVWSSGNMPEDIHYELRGDKFEHVYTWWAKYHGSQVAGVAGCLTNNNQGYASLGYNVKLVFSLISPSYIDSLRVRGAQIINCSWYNAFGDEEDLRQVIFNCLNSGIIITAGSGNDQENVDEIGTIPVVPYPAAYNFPSIGKQVIAVTATSMYNNSETFGWPPNGDWNYSPATDPINDPTNSFVDFAAPGVFIPVLDATSINGYTLASGTSLSAPLVAALLGLMRSIYPELTPETAYTILKNTSEKVGTNDYNYVNNTWSPRMGYGRINAYEALKYTIENYGGILTQTLTIPSGETWNFQPGVIVRFVNGASLIVNGTLNAVGNSYSRITFTRSGTSGTWGGIQFNSGSNGNIQYCTIQNATNGIFFNNTGSSSIQVSNCTIQNNLYNGLSLYNSSPLIKNNLIIYNGTNGIYCNSYSSPKINYNTLKWNSQSGLYCSSYSSPSAALYYYGPGNNVIRDNYGYGIFAQYNCVPSFGHAGGGGNNSIFLNSSHEVCANYGCTVYAQYNYWGTGSTISAYQSTIYNENPLPNDPNPGRSIIPTSENSDIATVNLSLNSPESNHNNLNYAESEILDDDEINKYKEIFLKERNTDRGRHALIMLEDSYWKTKKDGFVDFINKEILSRKNVKDELTVMAYELTNRSYIESGKYNQAVSNFEKIQKELLLNKEIEKNTLFNLGTLYLNCLDDKIKASDYFNELKTKFPGDRLVFDIDMILGDLNSRNNYMASNTDLSEKSINPISDNYELKECYPNPFNPTTTIRYRIAKDGFISLRVYDMLGREVAELVNENKIAGDYTVNFDGSKLSSGVYIYKLLGNNVNISKKMILMK